MLKRLFFVLSVSAMNFQHAILHSAYSVYGQKQRSASCPNLQKLKIVGTSCKKRPVSSEEAAAAITLLQRANVPYTSDHNSGRSKEFFSKPHAALFTPKGS